MYVRQLMQITYVRAWKQLVSTHHMDALLTVIEQIEVIELIERTQLCGLIRLK